MSRPGWRSAAGALLQRQVVVPVIGTLALAAAGLSLQRAAQDGQPLVAAEPRELDAADRAQLAHCLQHVHMVHDVRWAAACSGQPEDDSADCMLPDADAAKLNAALVAAEAACHSEQRSAP